MSFEASSDDQMSHCIQSVSRRGPDRLKHQRHSQLGESAGPEVAQCFEKVEVTKASYDGHY